jgi:hypothetical protein
VCAILTARALQDHRVPERAHRVNDEKDLRMNIKTDTVLTPPSDGRLKWFEKSYRVRLPADYKAFLTTSNGGVPITNSFVHGGGERIVETFLAILDDPGEDAGGWRDVSVVLSQLDERLVSDEEQVGMDIIPIAALFAGDFLCLDFRKSKSQPEVSIWDHEHSEELMPEMERVAGSFTEFIKLLR